MRLNLGCGNKKLANYVNIDKFGQPDLLCDLEKFPWPFGSDSVEEIKAIHSLEHMGETTEVFINILKEIYRICQDGASVSISVPHPRHDHFISDPTHVRSIVPDMLCLFSKRMNRQCIEKALSNSTLGLYYDIDFEIVEVKYNIDPMFYPEVADKSLEDVTKLSRRFNNVIESIDMILTIVKSPKTLDGLELVYQHS